MAYSRRITGTGTRPPHVLELPCRCVCCRFKTTIQEVSICTFGHKILHGLGTQAHVDPTTQDTNSELRARMIGQLALAISASVPHRHRHFDEVVVLLRPVGWASAAHVPITCSLVFFQFIIPAKTSWSIRATRPPSAGLVGVAVIYPSRLMYSVGHRGHLGGSPMDDLMTLNGLPCGSPPFLKKVQIPFLAPSYFFGMLSGQHISFALIPQT